MDKILIGRDYIREVIQKIYEETESIDICFYEIFHGASFKSYNVNHLIVELMEKMDRGVKIRCLMNTTLANPKNKENMQTFKNQVIVKGGQVVEIKKGILMHSKAIQFGKKYILIGSHNISDRSFKSHYEISVGVDSEEVNKKFAEWFDQFFS